MYCANVGDSRCILGKKLFNSTNIQGSWIDVSLSEDHKPSNDKERYRI